MAEQADREEQEPRGAPYRSLLASSDSGTVSVGDLPLAILTSVDLRHTQNVAPRLAVDRHLRPLVPGGECHLTDHVRSDDLVHVRGAVREGVGEVVEQVA